MKRIIVTVAAVAALIALAGLSVAPSTAGDAPDAKAVEALYAKKCAMCHGKDGVAKKMGEGSSNFNDPAWKETASKDAIVKITNEGKGKMPKYAGKLSPEEIDALAALILAME